MRSIRIKLFNDVDVFSKAFFFVISSIQLSFTFHIQRLKLQPEKKFLEQRHRIAPSLFSFHYSEKGQYGNSITTNLATSDKPSFELYLIKLFCQRKGCIFKLQSKIVQNIKFSLLIPTFQLPPQTFLPHFVVRYAQLKLETKQLSAKMRKIENEKFGSTEHCCGIR